MKYSLPFYKKEFSHETFRYFKDVPEIEYKYSTNKSPVSPISFYEGRQGTGKKL